MSLKRSRRRAPREPVPGEPRHSGLAGAYRMGYAAGRRGLGQEVCPYRPTRTKTGRPSWGSHYHLWWTRGWRLWHERHSPDQTGGT
jgi:hypothetical protein